MKKEHIFNVPNALTSIRVLCALFILYAIFAKFSLITVTYAFILGMLTDFLDGQVARRFHEVTEFGKKFDIIADRSLMIMTIVAVLNIFITQGYETQLRQLALLTTREIIAAPFLVYALVTKSRFIPKARKIGKLTTLMQGISLPLIVLSVYMEVFAFSIYAACMTAVVGLVSGMYYARDMVFHKYI